MKIIINYDNMKIISWNVNGIRACIKKGFLEFLEEENPDIIWIQETKWREDQVDKKSLEKIEALWYKSFWNPAERPWYSWTAMFSKTEPINVIRWIETQDLELDWIEIDEVIAENKEWRVITLEFEDFYYTTVYTPNSKSALERLEYRQDWDKAFLKFMLKLEEKKPVIFWWDLNVAHKEIDLKNSKTNKTTKTKPWTNGFTDQEREGFDNILESWFIDIFRKRNPEKEGAYSWWSYLWKARERNAWWRIDYMMISPILEEKIKDAHILSDVLWSDHCPVSIEI